MTTTRTSTCTSYTQIDASAGFPSRLVLTPLDSDQLKRLDRDGYLALPGILDPVCRADLVEAIDALRARIDAGALAGEYQPGEEFYRDLMVHDARFVALMEDPLLVGTARAMLGPRVRLRGMSCRDNRPETGGNQGFPWHIHQRVNCDPLPPWWSAPQGVDCLLYLDGLDRASGALAVIPGSHRDPTRRLAWDHVEYPDQVVVELPPGSVVVMHPNLAHRSIAAQHAQRRRRLVIVNWVPTWYRTSPYEKRDYADWIATMAERWADQPERLELLGIGGYS